MPRDFAYGLKALIDIGGTGPEVETPAATEAVEAEAPAEAEAAEAPAEAVEEVTPDAAADEAVAETEEAPEAQVAATDGGESTTEES